MKIDIVYYTYENRTYSFGTINYHSPREIYKYEPYGGTILRSFIDTNLVQVNSYRSAHANYCFMEYNNKFVDGATEIWYKAQDGHGIGWYVPPAYSDSTEIVGKLYSSKTNKEIPITSCNEIGAIAKDLNKNYRIPTIIETDIYNRKVERNKLLGN